MKKNIFDEQNNLKKVDTLIFFNGTAICIGINILVNNIFLTRSNAHPKSEINRYPIYFMF